MAMEKKKDDIDKELLEKMNRLQSSLVTLRKVGGWTAEEFSKEVGLTRQYYCELEKNSENKRLSISLYYCFLYLFEKKAAEKEDFKIVFENYLHNEKISNEQRNEVSKYIIDERKKIVKKSKAKGAVTAIIGASAVAASVIAIIASVIGRRK